MRRRVWAEDPDRLDAPLHYEVEVLRRRGRRPERARALVAADAGPRAPSRPRAGDRLAVRPRSATLLARDGRRGTAEAGTIDQALVELAEDGLVDGRRGPLVVPQRP